MALVMGLAKCSVQEATDILRETPVVRQAIGKYLHG